jgi:hypothetical protein
MSATRFRHGLVGRRRRGAFALVLGVLLLPALCAAASAPALGGTPRGIIFDLTATPSWMWEFHSAGNGSDMADDVAFTASGAAYVSGSLSNDAGNRDASLMKLVDGAPAWSAPKTYDSPSHKDDSAGALALGPGGVVYTAGPSVGANGLPDMLLLKWSASGAILWARRYDGPSHAVDVPTAIGVDTAGNVTVAGVTVDAGTEDWVVANWSPSGTRRWTSRLTSGDPHETVPMSVVIAADGSVYATGTDAHATGASALTIRYSRSGTVLWKKTYSGPAGLGAATRSSVASPQGGVDVCGLSRGTATGADGLVMSYTPQGARHVFALDTGAGGNTDQSFNDLTLTSTGEVVAVGFTTTGGVDDCRAVSFSVDGTIAGQVTLPGTWDDEFLAVAADAFGGFYATGYYHTAVNKVALLTTRGSVLTGGGGFASLWAPAFVSLDNEPSAIAVHGSTAMVVGGCSEGALHGLDQVVLGYTY